MKTDAKHAPDLLAALDKAESELDRLESASGIACDAAVILSIRAFALTATVAGD